MKKAMKLISGFIDPSMPLGSAGKKQLSITPSLHQETLYRPGRAVGNSDSKIKSCLDYNQCARPWQNDPSKLRKRQYAVCWLLLLASFSALYHFSWHICLCCFLQVDIAFLFINLFYFSFVIVLFHYLFHYLFCNLFFVHFVNNFVTH